MKDLQMENETENREKSEHPRVDDDAVQVRLDALIHLLEEDRIGYRLERFVAKEREELVQILTSETFSISNLQSPDLIGRVKEYDATMLPYLEFFAVGAAYSSAVNASLWADFVERVATCNMHRSETSNSILEQLTLYPALLLLYAAGLLAVVRKNWFAQQEILSRRFPFSNDAEKPFVLRTHSFSILSEVAQKHLPGRELEYTPLLNHIYDTLKPVFQKYVVSEARFATTVTTFEVILATAYGYFQEEQEKSRNGKVSERFWVPLGRCGWSDHGRVDELIRKANEDKDQWTPIEAGLFGGSVAIFIDFAQRVKTLITSHREAKHSEI
jgi:hypothetical protein